MPDEFQYDALLSHSSKEKAVVRPRAERLRQDEHFSATQPSTFDNQPTERFDNAPSKAPWCNSFTSTGVRQTASRAGEFSQRFQLLALGSRAKLIL